MSTKILVLQPHEPESPRDPVSAKEVADADVIIGGHGQILKSRVIGGALNLLDSLHHRTIRYQRNVTNASSTLSNYNEADLRRVRQPIIKVDYSIPGWDLLHPQPKLTYVTFTKQVEDLFGAGGHSIPGWDLR